MKIACIHCGNLYEDTELSCPKCGAVNKTVRMKDSSPKTIEDLRSWYMDRGLPPYETTRFFIGIDYKQPKAFGIFREGEMFIVYKNKADGTRSIRYAGSDEAYAVNELYMRLKEEILNQKGENKKTDDLPVEEPVRISSKTISANKRTNIMAVISAVLLVIQGLLWGANGFLAVKGQLPGNTAGILYFVHFGCFIAFLILVAVLLIFMCIGIVSKTNDNSYMNKQVNSGFIDGFIKICGAVLIAAICVLISLWVLKNDKNVVDLQRKGAFEASSYTPSKARSSTGYYKYDDTVYYHLYEDETGWYYFDTDYSKWFYEDKSYVPSELKSTETAEDFYYTPDWNSETQLTDFEDTDIYLQHVSREKKIEEDRQIKASEEERQRIQSEKYNHDSGDHDYDWDSNDSWDSGDTDWDSDW